MRNRELLECISGPLIELAAKNACEWAVNKPYAVLLLQIVATAIGMLCCGHTFVLINRTANC